MQELVMQKGRRGGFLKTRRTHVKAQRYEKCDAFQEIKNVGVGDAQDRREVMNDEVN